jgi:hypothetical protein
MVIKYIAADVIAAGDEKWFFVFFGLICLVGGIRTIVSRKGRVRGKGGHVTIYQGKEAIARGVLAVIIGVVVMAFAIAH